ncbi:carbohydrate ABC transporter membrane protein 1, CUT1 family [Microbacterium azadirachtae]|uniref:Carbohydrate ABC transporter membrane protein 1, CUT1 family n=1 Tax=Microbacterium azadirachtae TaxID=582680 RepID=A0A1I6GGD0_9MICO|nr:ABC transporter permease subunit [Microbacterium azadirachtae]SFR41264.1 carbohydrate ABC transporter membrane protein 1, CUT1 family [Microbacterium azadirachtae]
MSSYSEPLVQSTTTPGEGAADAHPARPASRGRRRAAAAGSVPAHRKRTLGQRIKRDRVMLLLIAPGFLYFVVFHWLPLPGNIVAFEDYQPYLGFIDSAWVGLDNFVKIFGDPTFWQALRNTLVITGLQLVLFFPIPIVLALLLNSIMSDRIRKFVQSVVYLPHFLGWVIIVSIFGQVLGATGVVPHLMQAMGLQPFEAMTTPWFFPFLVSIQSAWKDAGWGTIIFLAALMNIDQELYEAAAVDGAGPWQRMRTITIPGIMPVIILLLILNLGSILSVGFEQIVLQRDSVGAGAGEVLDTWVYYHGIQNGQWGPAAAVGLVKGVVGLALVLGANKVAHLFGQEGVYSRGK